MNFWLACLAWLAIAVVIGLGIFLMTVKGSYWLFILALVGFVVAVGKIGCATH